MPLEAPARPGLLFLELPLRAKHPTLIALLALALPVLATTDSARTDNPGAGEVNAREYLDAALATIADNAYYAGRVDWPTLRPELERLAAGATTPEETHPAIRRALQALGDNHSQLAPRSHVEMAASGPGSTSAGDSDSDSHSDHGIRVETLGRVGYLSVPGFAFTNAERSAEFSETLQRHLDAQAAAGACGWIIDLRGNTGGNMYPMIQGLSGLLGGETLGYFVSHEGRTPWSARRFGVSDVDLHELEGGTSAPVAVLQGRRTFSSGEATLLSFIGRANTRRFGEASGGLSTANRMFPLTDGAALVLTTSVMADRTGQVYGGPVEPDVQIWDVSRTDIVARQWVEAQPGCTD